MIKVVLPRSGESSLHNIWYWENWVSILKMKEILFSHINS